MTPCRSLLPALAASLLLGAPAAAQGEVGEKISPLEPKQLLNSRIKSMKDLEGQVVVYEFFAHW